jgi:hypothetical protein
MPLTGSLMFVYICIDVGDPVMASQPSPLLDHQHQYIYRQTLDYLLMAPLYLPSTGSPTSIHICLCINVGDPVEGRFWDAINR